MSDIKMIRVDGRQVGVQGLEQALHEMAGQLAELPEEKAGEALLQRLIADNYVPEPARAAYAKALGRELSRHLGRPVAEGEGGKPVLSIQVLGPGCANCQELTQRVMRVLEQLGAPAELEHLQDMLAIAAFDVVATPGLCIDGRIVSSGRVPSEAEIREMIIQAQG